MNSDDGGFLPFGAGGFVERVCEWIWLDNRKDLDGAMIQALNLIDQGWDVAFGGVAKYADG